jgi:uncharacterized protein (DUF1501 family)
MRRRTLLRAGLALAASPFAAVRALGAAGALRPDDRRTRSLVLVELKGGNDGLNTVVPFTDPAYFALRLRLALARDAVLPLGEHAALHPALAALLPTWNDERLAVLQGVGYPAPNLSHFRSIEIWDTASGSDEYRPDGWLARSFAAAPLPARFAADAVVIGSSDLGPFAGAGAQALTLANTAEFVRRARLVAPERPAAEGNRALRHVLKVEADIAAAAGKLAGEPRQLPPFPPTAFGTALAAACSVLANPDGVAALRVTLGGFDTHGNQLATQARLLGELGQGLAALRTALESIGRWDDTLVLTYAEFGRQPKENLSGGTDHGTASVHFALGGAVQGGLHGEAPRLDHLDASGNLAHGVDFRSVYATVLERWWGVASAPVLGSRFPPLAFLPA